MHGVHFPRKQRYNFDLHISARRIERTTWERSAGAEIKVVDYHAFKIALEDHLRIILIRNC